LRLLTRENPGDLNDDDSFQYREYEKISSFLEKEYISINIAGEGGQASRSALPDIPLVVIYAPPCHGDLPG
jgi:hypothetical protein